MTARRGRRLILSGDAHLSGDECRSMTSSGYVAIDSLAQLQELAAAAAHAQRTYCLVFGMTLSDGQLAQVRELRLQRRRSWRQIAQRCHERWHLGLWDPPSNQIAGMALCQVAAEYFGEDPDGPPWKPEPPLFEADDGP